MIKKLILGVVFALSISATTAELWEQKMNAALSQGTDGYAPEDAIFPIYEILVKLQVLKSLDSAAKKNEYFNYTQRCHFRGNQEIWDSFGPLTNDNINHNMSILINKISHTAIREELLGLHSTNSIPRSLVG